MMIYLRLFYEFFKVGLFSVGGGLATLPFLKEMGERTGWFTNTDMMNMLAVSESTPGPMGINMATYIGFLQGGIPGGIVATIGEVTPSLFIIMAVAVMLNKFRTNRYVDHAFYGLRPASAGLIAAACLSVLLTVLTAVRSSSGALFKQYSLAGGPLFSVPKLLLFAVLWLLANKVKQTKNLHPIAFVAIAAVVGICFRFAGV